MRKYRKNLRKELSPERLQIEILKMLKADYDGTIKMIRDFKLTEVLKNDDYNIFEIIKDIDIENFEGDLDNLIKERSS